MPKTVSPPEAPWRGRAAYAIYDGVGAVASLLCLPALPILLARGFGAGLGERLGRLPARAREWPEPPVWIHVASVGETLAALPLVSELRRRHPKLPIVFSTTTTTGRAVARREIDPTLAMLLPLDAWRIVDRVFRRLRPRALVVVETEIWPGLLRAAQAVGAPAVVVSGRVSARAARRYAWFAPLFRASLGKVSAFGMQTADDARRVIDLGAPAERVRVTGSLKAGRQATEDTALPFPELADRPVLIAASTQPGEEEFVLDSCAGEWLDHSDLLLVLAPRRPERFGAVARLVEERGLRFQRMSAMHALRGSTQVLVLDTLGDLNRLFPAARAVFVGGTVAPLGGHNVLEPALAAKPVAFGPHTDNVAAVAGTLLAAGGAECVQTPADLARFWRRCLDDCDAAARMGERARAVATSSDVVASTWEMLAPFIGAAK
jgi:3-deoxy-D-manno-octulosonic-acid transferase